MASDEAEGQETTFFRRHPQERTFFQEHRAVIAVSAVLVFAIACCVATQLFRPQAGSSEQITDQAVEIAAEPRHVPDTPVPTNMPESTATPAPTDTPRPTDTPVPTHTPTPKPTKTPRPTNTPRPIATPTLRPSKEEDYGYIPWFTNLYQQFTTAGEDFGTCFGVAAVGASTQSADAAIVDLAKSAIALNSLADEAQERQQVPAALEEAHGYFVQFTRHFANAAIMSYAAISDLNDGDEEGHQEHIQMAQMQLELAADAKDKLNDWLARQE